MRRPCKKVIDVSMHISPRLLGLCHSDLNRRNLLRHDGRTWVLDWELATLGDPAWDVAVLPHRGGLCPKDACMLRTQLAAVHSHPPAEDRVGPKRMWSAIEVAAPRYD